MQKNKKIVTIVGARPQFVKAACLSRALRESTIDEIIVHTGQHYDDNMSKVFFEEMEIPEPKYRFENSGQLHGQMTGRMIEKIEQVLIEEKPNLVVLYGDTNSTLAGAIAARKLNIKIAHIEAGLRNYDMTIPEDVNRILTDRVSDYLFCPTEKAISNLIAEGFDKFPVEIIRTGDIMADAVFYYSKYCDSRSKISLPEKKYILTTVHRAANTTPQNLKSIIEALNTLSENHEIVFPIHPRTKNILKDIDIQINSNVRLHEPLGYFDLLNHLKNCEMVITDSGGLQKEAYLLKKKSLLLMEFSPWVELVENGFSIETSSDYDSIIKNFSKLEIGNPDFSKNLYGNGNTAEQIVTKIKSVI